MDTRIIVKLEQCELLPGLRTATTANIYTPNGARETRQVQLTGTTPSLMSALRQRLGDVITDQHDCLMLGTCFIFHLEQ